MKVTEHAYDRMSERIGLNSSASQRMAQKALEKGIKHNETSGKLNRYLSSLFYAYKTANNIRIYGEHVYLFSNEVLITVLYLDNEYKSTVKKILSRRKD